MLARVNMSYSKEFKVFVATIYGEAGASSVRSWEVIAHCIRNRIGFGNWTGYSTMYGIVTETGFDAYTDNTPPYRNAMSRLDDNNFNSDIVGRTVKNIIDTVLPIYEGKVKDDTNGVVYYWSPRAQEELHRKYPKRYTSAIPDWVKDNKKEIVTINGTENDDFQWLRFKRSKMFITLCDNKGLPIDGASVDIRFASGKKVPVLSGLKTNNRGQLPAFFARIEMGARFIVNGTYLKDQKGNNLRILPTGKDIVATIIVDSGNGFKSSLERHETDMKNSQNRNNNNANNKVSIASSEKDDSILSEVTFNIQLVEGDTGKPLPNQTYYLDYKNNIKPHTTDASGIDANIKADVDQSISVLLPDDDGKKQSIYSMAFPVTVDLNEQTKVLKVPVVSFSIRFVDVNDKIIPNYAFKTIYRDRESKIRKANSQGITQLKALAGQKITIIDSKDRAKASGIVTDGALKWTIRINGLGVEEAKTDDKSPKTVNDVENGNQSKSDISPEDKPTPEIKVEKPKIKEKETITEKGPTHEVESDETEVVIKFLDESTNKPISGLTYFTESTYGKNASVTGSDGTRGKPHISAIGVEITVLVYEDGKEVEKGRFTVSHDRDEPYVYKAKKPTYSDVKVKFTTKRTSVVSEKTKAILRELAYKNGMNQIVVTSTLRTPEEQARAMYNNISNGKVIRYAPPGAEVTKICQEGLRKRLGRNQIIKNMVAKILEYDRKGLRVSLHCVSSDSYAKMNIIDLGINSNGFNSTSRQRKFQAVCEQAKKEGKISRILSPLTNKGEPAFHLEIPQ